MSKWPTVRNSVEAELAQARQQIEELKRERDEARAERNRAVFKWDEVNTALAAAEASLAQEREQKEIAVKSDAQSFQVNVALGKRVATLEASLAQEREQLSEVIIAPDDPGVECFDDESGLDGIILRGSPSLRQIVLHILNDWQVASDNSEKLATSLAQAQKERDDYFADIHRLSEELAKLYSGEIDNDLANTIGTKVAQARREGMEEAIAVMRKEVISGAAYAHQILEQYETAIRRATEEGRAAQEHPELIHDGFGGIWSAWCPDCGRKTMEVVRPGKVQCTDSCAKQRRAAEEK